MQEVSKLLEARSKRQEPKEQEARERSTSHNGTGGVHQSLGSRLPQEKPKENHCWWGEPRISMNLWVGDRGWQPSYKKCCKGNMQNSKPKVRYLTGLPHSNVCVCMCKYIYIYIHIYTCCTHLYSCFVCIYLYIYIYM